MIFDIAEKRKTHAGADRRDKEIDVIVVHAMCEWIAYKGNHYHAVDFLNEIGLSCHYMVGSQGSVIECADPKKRITWHAAGFNTHSIGIEVLVPGVYNYGTFIDKIKTRWVDPKQFSATCLLVQELMQDYPIYQLVRHCDISPQRKVDPGYGFPWEELTGWLDFQKETKH